MRLFKSKKSGTGPQRELLPKHLAIIMDGNGRWAKLRGLPRSVGHSAGAETFRRIATYCKNIGIDYLTVYAFSTENWKRPAEEVSAIMSLFEKYLDEAIEKMEKEGIRLKILGDRSILSDTLRSMIEKTEQLSEGMRGFQANLCINYGSRDEIARAARGLAASGREITAEGISESLDSAGIPDPDLVIRPGGEKRVSNFLLWQTAYSELYFSDVLWPDFDEAELDKALADFAQRKRRYGGV